MNILMHAPIAGTGNNPVYINGRSYTTVPGTPIQMPDADADVAGANGWMKAARVSTGVGTTANRPASPKRGDSYEDTTVGASIIYDGATWRNRVSGASV